MANLEGIKTSRIIRDWYALLESLVSSAEDPEKSVARFTSLVRARDIIPKTQVLVRDRILDLSQVSPRFLHANSTSHTWPFSAVAELIDNAYDPDVNASELWIDKRVINNVDCLTFVDNGNGMNTDKLYKMLSFGYNEKVQVGDLKPIGYYGNGFKSGSMRLGKDALVFTRCLESMSVGFLSQSYLEAIGADAVIVPIVSWRVPSKNRVVTPASDNNLKALLKYSIFSTEGELMAELANLEKCRTGTNIIIYNLKTDKMGKYELDFESDLADFRNPETHVVDLTTLNRPIHTASPEYRRSLREYCSILYLKPRMKIILRGQKVKTKMISKSLSKTETDVYKPTWLNKPVKIVLGFTSNQEPESYGLMMYYKNRLIKAFEKVGVQKQANDLGVGVVGVVETDFLEPTHIKQDWNRTEKYSAFMQSVSQKLNEYYNEKTYGKPTVEQIQQLPDWTWAQCDNCLKWRRLPTDYQDKLPEKWFCRLNPDAAFNRCDIEEEPEDDDEALQTSYVKTYKKKQEEKRRQTKAEEERKILEREQQLRNKEKMVERKYAEYKKQQELEVSSSQDRNKPTLADFERAKSKLDDFQQKMREQENTIQQLSNQKQRLERQKKQLLDLAESVKLSSSQHRLLVDRVVGTSSSTVTSSSTSANRKRKGDNVQGSGNKMFIKTEEGEMVEVTKMDEEEENLIDLTADEDDDSSSNDNENRNNNAEPNRETEGHSAGENKNDSATDNAQGEAKDANASQNTSLGEQLDIKPDKAMLDKKIKETEKLSNKASQTVPVVMKLATLEESEILKLSQIEKNTMLISKMRELEESKGNLTSLQENIYRLLKIIVPDYDYGEPQNVEKVILEFIRVNEEESQESTDS